jgi:hypothetical protein
MVVGTSLHKNGSGLNKTDAEFLHGKDVRERGGESGLREAAAVSLEATRYKSLQSL